MNAAALLRAGDAVSQVVVLLLLAMSVASWVVILWKARLLLRAVRDTERSLAAFWQAASLAQARAQVAVFDRAALLLPLLDVTLPPSHSAPTLAAATDRSQHLTRLLRNALNHSIRQLQFGQVLLATVGSTAPFVGLLGTVWGIHHALSAIASAGQITIERIAGPVGEALIMTAAGLAVAIPAVLAYNVLGRRIAHLEAELEGFAHDWREWLLHQAATGAAAP